MTMLEGGGGSAAHKKTVTAQIPKKAVSCYIDLQKADKDTEETKPQGNAEFSGAVYEVKNKAGTVVDKMTTNTSGKATSVPLATGTYTVREVTAPKGYNLDKNTYTVTFTNTDLNQTVYRKSVRSEEPVKKGNVTLKKLSSESDKTLKGAVFYLYTSKNKKVGEYTTDDKGCITVKNLPWNSYFFIEQTAPEGYELSDEKIGVSDKEGIRGKNPGGCGQEYTEKSKTHSGKEIRADEINFANGNPIFLFEVKGVDLEGKTHILHGTAEFTREYTEQEKKTGKEVVRIRKTVTFSELPAGTYTAYEMEVMRYSPEDITEITGGTRKEDTGWYLTSSKRCRPRSFINHKDEWQDSSDTSVCEIIILKRERKNMSEVRKKERLKEAAALLLLILLLTAAGLAVGVGSAYFSDQDARSNRIRPGDSNLEITEEFHPPDELKPGEVIAKSVQIANKGKSSCFIRCKASYG